MPVYVRTEYENIHIKGNQAWSELKLHMYCTYTHKYKHTYVSTYMNFLLHYNSWWTIIFIFALNTLLLRVLFICYYVKCWQIKKKLTITGDNFSSPNEEWEPETVSGSESDTSIDAEVGTFTGTGDTGPLMSGPAEIQAEIPKHSQIWNS